MNASALRYDLLSPLNSLLWKKFSTDQRHTVLTSVTPTKVDMYISRVPAVLRILSVGKIRRLLLHGCRPSLLPTTPSDKDKMQWSHNILRKNMFVPPNRTTKNILTEIHNFIFIRPSLSPLLNLNKSLN